MRTHRLKITMNSIPAADWYERECVHQFFVDMTHWYCGLDDAGEDTPDTCVVYRGIMERNVIYVDFDAQSMFQDCAANNAQVALEHFKVGPTMFNGYEVLNVELSELESYDKVKSLQEEIDELKDKVFDLEQKLESYEN